MRNNWNLLFISFTFLFMLLLFNSCNRFILWAHSGPKDKDLGGNYYLTRENFFSSIIYDWRDKHKGSGLEVIRFEVLNTFLVQNFILAVSIDDTNVHKSYWLIDKNKPINLDDCNNQKNCDSVLQSNVAGPMDSLSFYNYLLQNKITLKSPLE